MSLGREYFIDENGNECFGAKFDARICKTKKGFRFIVGERMLKVSEKYIKSNNLPETWSTNFIDGADEKDLLYSVASREDKKLITELFKGLKGGVK